MILFHVFRTKGNKNGSVAWWKCSKTSTYKVIKNKQTKALHTVNIKYKQNKQNKEAKNLPTNSPITFSELLFCFIVFNKAHFHLNLSSFYTEYVLPWWYLNTMSKNIKYEYNSE